MKASPALEQQLTAIARGAPWFMRALAAVRGLDLPNWCIGAGAVRNLVWDALHGYPLPSTLPDIDVVYFDPDSQADEQDAAIQSALSSVCPELSWEVTNQAHVHRWLALSLGQQVAPFRSLEAAVASWPEFATAVGVRLEKDDTLTVIAPHGLDDLFAMIVRHNPASASIASYLARVAGKRFAERWPQVSVVIS